MSQTTHDFEDFRVCNQTGASKLDIWNKTKGLEAFSLPFLKSRDNFTI
jgi:hypothetical protein